MSASATTASGWDWRPWILGLGLLLAVPVGKFWELLDRGDGRGDMGDEVSEGDLNGTVYVIDSVNGSDSNGGRANSDAWQTIAKLNNETIPDGESVCLMDDSSFATEALKVDWGGDVWIDSCYMDGPALRRYNDGSGAGRGAEARLGFYSATDPRPNLTIHDVTTVGVSWNPGAYVIRDLDKPSTSTTVAGETVDVCAADDIQGHRIKVLWGMVGQVEGSVSFGEMQAHIDSLKACADDKYLILSMHFNAFGTNLAGGANSRKYSPNAWGLCAPDYIWTEGGGGGLPEPTNTLVYERREGNNPKCLGLQYEPRVFNAYVDFVAQIKDWCAWRANCELVSFQGESSWSQAAAPVDGAHFVAEKSQELYEAITALASSSNRLLCQGWSTGPDDAGIDPDPDEELLEAAKNMSANARSCSMAPDIDPTNSTQAQYKWHAVYDTDFAKVGNAESAKKRLTQGPDRWWKLAAGLPIEPSDWPACGGSPCAAGSLFLSHAPIQSTASQYNDTVWSWAGTLSAVASTGGVMDQIANACPDNVVSAGLGCFTGQGE